MHFSIFVKMKTTKKVKKYHFLLISRKCYFLLFFPFWSLFMNFGILGKHRFSSFYRFLRISSKRQTPARSDFLNQRQGTAHFISGMVLDLESCQQQIHCYIWRCFGCVQFPPRSRGTRSPRDRLWDDQPRLKKEAGSSALGRQNQPRGLRRGCGKHAWPAFWSWTLWWRVCCD